MEKMGLLVVEKYVFENLDVIFDNFFSALWAGHQPEAREKYTHWGFNATLVTRVSKIKESVPSFLERKFDALRI